MGINRSRAASNAVTVTLTNVGSASLNITSITASGDFQQTNTCGTFVTGGAGTCTIQITFTPTSVGLQTDQITITDSSGGKHNIAVTGNGVLTGRIFAPHSGQVDVSSANCQHDQPEPDSSSH